jgi:hypothetical protein
MNDIGSCVATVAFLIGLRQRFFSVCRRSLILELSNSVSSRAGLGDYQSIKNFAAPVYF